MIGNPNPRFSYIRKQMSNMKLEFEAIQSQNGNSASDIWDAINVFGYISDLSDKSLENIRLHTSIFSGAPSYDPSFKGLKRGASDEALLKEEPSIVEYEKYISGIPDKYHAAETIINHTSNWASFNYKNKILGADIFRYQRTISNLYNTGVFRDFVEEKRANILEIGGGYGGLAVQLYKVLNENCCYTIIDLPLSIYYSSIYVSLAFPNARIFIGTKEELKNTNLDDLVKNHDFIFIPHYSLDDLAFFPDIDLAINMLSFQEMTMDQIANYSLFLRYKVRGVLYIENDRKHIFNKQLSVRVTDILERDFEMIPPAIAYDLMGIFGVYQAFPYICISKDCYVNITPINPVLYGHNVKIPFCT